MASTIIPTELIRPIIENIKSKPTLCSLYLSSKLLKETERILYGSFTETREDEVHKLFLTTIVSNQRLAEFVRVFHSPRTIKDNTYSGQVWTLTKLGLERMHGLKQLSLLLHPYYSELRLEIASVLEHCTFSLKNLVWFLERQVSLKSLHFWRPGSSPLAVPSIALPDLRTLSSYGIVPLVLLLGRRIRHLRWTISKMDIVQSRLSNISEALGRLVSLSLNLSGYDDIFVLIAKYLRSLEDLELSNYSSVDYDVIATLPCLRILVLSHTHLTPIPVDGREMRVQIFFAASPRLIRVDKFHHLVKSTQMYERWEEDGINQDLNSFLFEMKEDFEIEHYLRFIEFHSGFKVFV
ncbi:hypothetical protein BDZ97DRAFT_1768612 [Flammula alnicola]|nr:hypothetical protein BDZ97DRAFT_1768612 [Flammula alnicola]